jgi:hypothetical protein
MNILIMPCARNIGQNRNPREYPYWEELKKVLLSSGHVVKIQHENIPLPNLKPTLLNYDLILTIDSFIQHFCWYHGIKCAVIWGPSDYRIFGHKENINITKKEYAPRPDQFNTWNGVEYNTILFPTIDEVLSKIL